MPWYQKSGPIQFGIWACCNPPQGRPGAEKYYLCLFFGRSVWYLSFRPTTWRVATVVVKTGNESNGSIRLGGLEMEQWDLVFQYLGQDGDAYSSIGMRAKACPWRIVACGN